MRNLLLTIAFDGRPYHGWQVQRNAVTVQSVLQDALESVLGERPPVKGCSRTDAGVHARMFCLSLVTGSDIPAEALVPALNGRLPESVAALSCREVPMDFHARYDVVAKQYRYMIHNSRVRDPFLSGRAWRVTCPLCADEMNREGQALIGSHDFTSFCASGGKVMESHVRTVSGFEVIRQGDMIDVYITSNGFLYNMVRIITGTLVDIQRGVIPRGSLPAIMAAKNRGAAGMTAPPEGLYLNEVIYSKCESRVEKEIVEPPPAPSTHFC